MDEISLLKPNDLGKPFVAHILPSEQTYHPVTGEQVGVSKIVHVLNDLGNYIDPRERRRQREIVKENRRKSKPLMATLSLLDTILKSTMKRQVAKRTMTPEDYQKAFSHPSLSEIK